MRFQKQFFSLLIFLICSYTVYAQDERVNLPGVLKNAYFGINVGYINYDFGASQLLITPTDYKLSSIKINHPAVRLVLYGYEFNKYIAAQITYMRPVNWVFYYFDPINNGSVSRHSVWMNVGGLTLRPQLPITNKLSINGEVGLALVTRHGFKDDANNDIISGVTYPSWLLGTGLVYNLDNSWRLLLSGVLTPKNTTNNQPTTTFISAGFNYKLQPVSEKKIAKAAETGYINPKQWIQIGYTNNALGYGINNTLEKASLFWGGDVEVHQGLTVCYQRNIFHTPKLFALDWGVSASAWQTRGVGSGLSNSNKESFFTLSVYPILRFNILHTKPFDAYTYYSIAGPTYISKTDFNIQNIHGVNEMAFTGEHFTFQDNIGLGAFFGTKRNLNAEFRIGHYSNGNIFPVNAAFKIPLSFNIGYAF